MTGLISALLLAEVVLVELHGPGNQIIYVNPSQITNIREPRDMNLRHFAVGTRCVVIMTNGNFIAVHDPCRVVRQQLEGPLKP
jgi:hypothetical protein